ncbi:MAG: hypothetical protein FD126_1023, partial [Elusimicrobia bacterium]
MDVTPAAIYLTLGFLFAGHVAAEVIIIRRLLRLPFKPALAACLSSDAAAGALAIGAFILGQAVIGGLTRMGKILDWNSNASDFLDDRLLMLGCLIGFVALRAILIPPLIGRAGRLLHMEGIPVIPDARPG